MTSLVKMSQYILYYYIDVIKPTTVCEAFGINKNPFEKKRKKTPIKLSIRF